MTEWTGGRHFLAHCADNAFHQAALTRLNTKDMPRDVRKAYVDRENQALRCATNGKALLQLDLGSEDKQVSQYFTQDQEHIRGNAAYRIVIGSIKSCIGFRTWCSARRGGEDAAQCQLHCRSRSYSLVTEMPGRALSTPQAS